MQEDASYILMLSFVFYLMESLQPVERQKNFVMVEQIQVLEFLEVELRLE